MTASLSPVPERTDDQGLPDLAPALDPKVTQTLASQPDISVWVNASAGSGKTTVLTSRVLRLLLAGVKPQKILCLTYTRAAAAEMSIRIMKRLSLWAVCSDDDLRHELDELQNVAPLSEQLTQARRLFAQVLACRGGMRIRTIHAFCQEILGRFPVEAGLPPHFAVIEEGDATTLIESTLRDLLRQAAAAPTAPLGKALTYLVAERGGHSFTDAMKLFLHDRARFDQARRQAGGLDRLDARLRAALKLEPGETASMLITTVLAPDIMPRAELLRTAKLVSGDKPTYADRARKLLVWLAEPSADPEPSFAAYCDCFLTQKGEPFAKYASVDLLKRHPGIDTVLRDEALRLLTIRDRLDALRIAETTHALNLCAATMIDGYAAGKRAQAALDYDDLITLTLALLRRPGIAPWVLYKLDGGLDHIMVDEAQDTSQPQWDIIATLAEEFFAGRSARDGQSRTIFVVGDEKQSIYSFQRADPVAFLNMRRYFADKITAADRPYRNVDLRVSFRSASAVLEAVDLVFASEAARNGVAAAPTRHYPFKRDKYGRVELWPLQPAPVKDKSGESWQIATTYEQETDPQADLADRIADTIAGWLKRGETIPGEKKPIAAGDIMILLRRRGRFADLMVRALKRCRVPVTGVDRMHLIRQLPVMDLLALLQFALLPEDDLNLATILRGPFIGLDEDRLMQIAIGRADRGEPSLWQALKNAAVAHPALQAAADYLHGWLNEADFVTPFAMLADILNRPCPGNIHGGRRAIWARLGLDALDPVDELLNAAQSYSHRHAPSLQCFLHWLTAADTEIKRELDHGAGQVRIMTVHASKGLEAPIVFLPDTVALPDTKQLDRLFWHQEGDSLVPVYIAAKPASGLPRRLWDDAQVKQLQEYRRLLYVALTRASHRLYIAGWETKPNEIADPGNWYNLVKAALAPHHRPSAILPHDPAPDIVIADALIDSATKATAVQPPAALPPQPLPGWARTMPPEEQQPRPVAVPSQGAVSLTGQIAPAAPGLLHPATATPDDAFTRGRIIHRLLQSLPDIAPDRRAAAAAHFLANPQHALVEAQQAAIAKEVLDLLDDPAAAPLFGPDSRAEIPLAGVIDGQPVSGQIDRLCLRGDEVWIVDYKTNRPPPQSVEQVPELYRRQLAAYHLILMAIYPGKTIRCFLLWTYSAALMELPSALLAA